jgi:hypothetical protein
LSITTVIIESYVKAVALKPGNAMSPPSTFSGFFESKKRGSFPSCYKFDSWKALFRTLLIKVEKTE